MGQNGPKWSKKNVLLLFFANWVILSKKINNFYFRILGFSGSLFRWFFGPFWPPGAKLRFFLNIWSSPSVRQRWVLPFYRKSDESNDSNSIKWSKTSKKQKNGSKLKIRIFGSWSLFLAQKFFNIFFPQNCPQSNPEKSGFCVKKICRV